MEKKPVKPITWEKWLLIVPVILFVSALPVLKEYRDTGDVDLSRIVIAVIIFFSALIISVIAGWKGKK